ncbi:hypothetical protein [Microbacterium wangchenii]|uniref:hypothetical protein n=1 Tax=Microbacterium wangchenii TaxID=2541726 RepID=UPI0011CAADFD|nr:hypothetical protein [Microbacterium wangchenii]TXK11137.1 hypothetical protein FVP99_17800 [Microbacterium wangchenii]
MASWQAGRFITDSGDASEVEKLLALMPVQEAGSLADDEKLERRVACTTLLVSVQSHPMAALSIDRV